MKDSLEIRLQAEPITDELLRLVEEYPSESYDAFLDAKNGKVAYITGSWVDKKLDEGY
jgi:hypothetical protein